MPFAVEDLLKARKAFQEFLTSKPEGRHHDRYIFPFFAGSYFAYRKLDVLRTVAVANSVSKNPSFVDFGCGYGDFLQKMREFIPDARGVESDPAIFSILQAARPDYISISPVELFGDKIDVAFVGWMEPGQDFRRHVARNAGCVITTFDAGGQCGINGACEYDEFGFLSVASWRTPSWIDVNAELMNKYYTPGIDDKARESLASLRTAHNLWHVYARKENFEQVQGGLVKHLESETEIVKHLEPYEFEAVLDDCGFGYREELGGLSRDKKLWQVRFER